MPAPFVVAAAATIARYAVKYGAALAAKKYGKTAVQNAMKGSRGPKRKVKEKSDIDYTSGLNIGKNPAPQTSKPSRAPVFKKGSKFSKARPMQGKAKERTTNIQGARVPRKPSTRKLRSK